MPREDIVMDEHKPASTLVAGGFSNSGAGLPPGWTREPEHDIAPEQVESDHWIWPNPSRKTVRPARSTA